MILQMFFGFHLFQKDFKNSLKKLLIIYYMYMFLI
ncbi:hypothetical protein DESC_720407 [Desulfosarcina cetonica]|nr:hypothetical protein DESC_720407 [Desulfosarcina cetonica]